MPDTDTEKAKRLGIRSIAPNVVTVLALSAGVTGVKFALDGRWEAAVFAIILAGIFDGIDGSVARMLKAASKFGAELDSLSDVVSFGVAPALVLYMWSLQSLGGVGWIISLGYVVCCALRLARFNSRIDADDEPRRQAGFLTGFPAPMAAGLAMVPLMIEFEWAKVLSDNPELVGVWVAFVSFGMVSSLPTFSLKQLNVRRDHLVPILLMVGLLAASLTAYGWSVLLLVGVWYISTMPFSLYRYSQYKKERAARGGDPV